MTEPPSDITEYLRRATTAELLLALCGREDLDTGLPLDELIEKVRDEWESEI